MSEILSVKACKGCGKLFDEIRLNTKGYCVECAVDHMHDCIRSMIEKKGETYERYKRGMKNYVDSL